MKQTTVYILLLLLTACQFKDRLDMALEYAGDNRKAVSMPIYNAATFEYHMDGPFADPEINRLDIPPLFRNPCMKNGMIQWY